MPNNSFKPKPLRYTKGMAGKACHAFGSTTRFGLTQALGRMRNLLLGVIFFQIAGCGSDVAPEKDPRMERVNFMLGSCARPRSEAQKLAISDLTSAPERFDGKFVQVSGHYYSYFEHSAIYSTPEARPYSHKFSDGIWLSGVGPGFGGKHVDISGIFSHKVKGHLGQWPGTICVISVAETQ